MGEASGDANETKLGNCVKRQIRPYHVVTGSSEIHA